MKAIAFAAVIIVAMVGGCTVGPFYPPHPHACDTDVECPDHSACRFPCRMPDLNGTKCAKICMSGRESDVYGWSPTGE